MMYYIVEFSLLFAFLGLFYFLFLRNDSNYNLQRAYIFIAVICSIGIPQLPALASQDISIYSVLLPQVNIALGEQINRVEVGSTTAPSMLEFLFYFYSACTLVLLTRLVASLVKLTMIILHAEQTTIDGRQVLLSDEIESACSFFSNIILPKTKELNQEDLALIVEHESLHIKYGHSFEKLFLEVMFVFLWWHPSIWHFKSQLSLVHEYQVDRAMTQKVSVHQYKEILLQFIYPTGLRMSNPFSSQIKKRIIMMETKSREKNILKQICLVAFCLAGIFGIHACSQDSADIVKESPKMDFKEESYVIETVDTVSTFDMETKEESTQLIKHEMKVYNKVDQMPRFPGCDESEGPDAYEKCSNKKLLEYIYTNIKYPEEAKEADVEGMSVVKFVVDTHGKIDHIKFLKEMGYGVEDEVRRMMDKMQKEIVWKPGQKDGKVVNVAFTLPVKFKLQ